MGLTAVVENLRALKKTVKKPINAFRETVHNAYTKAYVGSPERVDEFYNYIKVYQPSKHNDLCMMSITADINRFSMLPDKHTFFHVHKLERHFDRMILARKQQGVNGDMAIQILSGHNMTFMARYRRYKTRAAAKEAKRNAKRHMALNVKRHTQLPTEGTSSGEASVYPDVALFREPVRVVLAAPVASKTVGTTSEDLLEQEQDDKELAEISKAISDVVLACEITQPETVLAAPDTVPTPVLHPSELEESQAQEKVEKDSEFLVACCKGTSKLENLEAKKVVSTQDRFNLTCHVKAYDRQCELIEAEKMKYMKILEDIKNKVKAESEASTTAVAASDSDSDSSEFDNLDSDSDASDIEELEKIEDKDVDALEYEMI